MGTATQDKDQARERVLELTAKRDDLRKTLRAARDGVDTEARTQRWFATWWRAGGEVKPPSTPDIPALEDELDSVEGALRLARQAVDHANQRDRYEEAARLVRDYLAAAKELEGKLEAAFAVHCRLWALVTRIDSLTFGRTTDAPEVRLVWPPLGATFEGFGHPDAPAAPFRDWRRKIQEVLKYKQQAGAA